MLTSHGRTRSESLVVLYEYAQWCIASVRTELPGDASKRLIVEVFHTFVAGLRGPALSVAHLQSGARPRPPGTVRYYNNVIYQTIYSEPKKKHIPAKIKKFNIYCLLHLFMAMFHLGLTGGMPA